MKHCKYCKRPIKERTDRKVRFRSVSCANKSRRKNFPKPCAYCKNLFLAPQNHNNQKHCSTNCRDKARNQREIVSCSWCGKKIERAKNRATRQKNFYCSKKCESAWRRLNDPKGNKHPQYVNRETFTCEICGKEVSRLKSRIKTHMFCSHKRSIKWQRTSGYTFGAKSPTWRGGHNDYRGPNWNKQKQKALVRDNYTCQKCGQKENLQVHHINPFNQFDDYKLANELDNLLTLCLSCHKRLEWECQRENPYSKQVSSAVNII